MILLSVNLKGSDHLGDQGVDARLIQHLCRLGLFSSRQDPLAGSCMQWGYLRIHTSRE